MASAITTLGRATTSMPAGAEVYLGVISVVQPPLNPPAPVPQLEEWEQDPSPGMMVILDAIAEVMESLMKELQKTNRIDM